RLLRVRHPRRLRRRLWPGLQRRLSPPAVCRGAARGSRRRLRQEKTTFEAGPGDAPGSAADRRRRERLDLSGPGPGPPRHGGDGGGRGEGGEGGRLGGGGAGAGRGGGRADRVDGYRSAEGTRPGRAVDGRAAGDLAAAVLWDLALHAEPHAVVPGEPGRPGVRL